MIYVYSKKIEDYSFLPNNYYIGRAPKGSINILGNPYSYLPEDKCVALYKCKTREESIEKFGEYFDVMYGSNKAFTKKIDEIYEKYKNGEDVYLECWCKKYKIEDQNKHEDELSCHGDVIKQKLEKRLIKEKLKEYRANK